METATRDLPDAKYCFERPSRWPPSSDYRNFADLPNPGSLRASKWPVIGVLAYTLQNLKEMTRSGAPGEPAAGSTPVDY